MKALIPVAGIGSRMRPHTLLHPKVLLPVADKPMIAHIIDRLLEDGIDELIFIVGHLGEDIESYVKETYDVKCHFLEQTAFLGLGHAIYTASEFLDEKPMVIVLGDTIYDVNLDPVLKGGHSSLGVKEVDNPRRFGVAVLDKNGFIEKLVEKPTEPVSNLALMGLYFIRHGSILRDALKELIDQDIRTKNEFQLTDALQIMINKGEKINVFKVDGWYDCGKPETLLETNGIILSKNFSDTRYEYENTIIIPPVYIHSDALIEKSVIGPNVTIGKHARIHHSIIQNAIIGPNAEIDNMELKDSLIGDFATINGRLQVLNVGDFTQLKF